jgi:hypothetical protein
MADLLLQFPWRVAKAGYSWVQSHPAFGASQQAASFLTDRRPIGTAGFHVMEYQPLVAFPGLFRVFADTEPRQDRIKAFADRFGPLGRNVAREIPLSDQRNAKGVPLGMGESLAAWNEEILTMRFAIDIWEAARNGDVGRLERAIFWTEDGHGVQILSHPELADEPLPDPPARVERAWIAGTHLGDDVHERFVQGDLVKPALHYVQSKTNEKLQGRASPRLLWDKKRDTLFRQCAECGIWFELAPGTARADKLYCSTPCRTKAYRKRQAEAVRLHGEGRSLEDIARELESDPDTVRGWIERKRGSGGSPQSETE